MRREALPLTASGGCVRTLGQPPLGQTGDSTQGQAGSVPDAARPGSTLLPQVSPTLLAPLCPVDRVQLGHSSLQREHCTAGLPSPLSWAGPTVGSVRAGLCTEGACPCTRWVTLSNLG